MPPCRRSEASRPPPAPRRRLLMRSRLRRGAVAGIAYLRREETLQVHAHDEVPCSSSVSRDDRRGPERSRRLKRRRAAQVFRRLTHGSASRAMESPRGEEGLPTARRSRPRLPPGCVMTSAPTTGLLRARRGAPIRGRCRCGSRDDGDLVGESPTSASLEEPAALPARDDLVELALSVLRNGVWVIISSPNASSPRGSTREAIASRRFRGRGCGIWPRRRLPERRGGSVRCAMPARPAASVAAHAE